MRRYKMTPDGEQPVWASKAKLREMGREEGLKAAREGREPIRMSNTTYDQAAREAWEQARKR